MNRFKYFIFHSGFIKYVVILFLLLGITVTAFFNECLDWCWLNCLTLGEVVPISTSISMGVVALIAIAISVNKDKFCGIKLYDYYKLRDKNFLQCIDLISLFLVLSVLSTIFDRMQSNFALFLTLVTTVVLIIDVIFFELPVLFFNKKHFIATIKRAVILMAKYPNQFEYASILNNALASLCCNESTLFEMFDELTK